MSKPVQRVKLTKTFVDSVTPEESGQTIYRDSELIGFALRVTKSKVYIVERRIGDAKSSVRVKIGQHGLITPAQAREQATQLLAKMAQGINPNEEKLEVKAAKLAEKQKLLDQPTLRDAYTVYKSQRQLKPKTLEDYDQCFDDYLMDWQDLRLMDITRTMIQVKHAQLSERSKARANLAMRFYRAVFNFSVEHYLGEDDQPIINISNPVRTLTSKRQWNKIKRRKGHIRDEQMSDWINAILAYQWRGQHYNDPSAFTNQDFLITLILTGFRREEMESLPWANVDLKYGTLLITDTKNGEDHLLPMGDLLWQIIGERRQRDPAGLWVFPSKKSESGHIENRSKARDDIYRTTGIKFTFHDLRRTFSSIANGQVQAGRYTIKRLLNHTDENTNDVTGGYVQVSMADLRSAMNQIEDIVISQQQEKNIINRSANLIDQ
ncbi:MAG: DUF4102 domain-containing protein [Moraxellaceae bacterium]|nr:MAG: DUF4102 domain-containing protein [Moraxellaceae bacterium]